MADEKVRNLEVLRPLPRIELREFALAAYYPRTAPVAPLLAAIAVAAPGVHPLERPQRDNSSPLRNVAKPWKKPWDK
jgi:hypothetical protein